jgi:hypothetical protein
MRTTTNQNETKTNAKKGGRKPVYPDDMGGLLEFKQAAVSFLDESDGRALDIEMLCDRLNITRQTLFNYGKHRGTAWQAAIEETKRAITRSRM